METHITIGTAICLLVDFGFLFFCLFVCFCFWLMFVEGGLAKRNGMLGKSAFALLYELKGMPTGVSDWAEKNLASPCSGRKKFS